MDTGESRTSYRGYPLVMTASIRVNGMEGLSVSDQQERSQQYLSTLEFYLRSGWVNQVVFAENSGADLEEFEDLVAAYPNVEVELWCFELNDFPRELGKSYGEMQLLDRVLCKSRFVADAGGFAKVTGRFPFLNLDRLLEEAQRRAPWDLFCDTKDHAVYDWMRIGWNGHAADTRFFIVTTAFYKRHFYGKYTALNDSEGRLVEGLFFDVIKQHRDNETIVSRFKVEPEPSGQAGHRQISIIGTNDYSGWLAKSKRRIRQIGRWLFPWFWF